MHKNLIGTTKLNGHCKSLHPETVPNKQQDSQKNSNSNVKVKQKKIKDVFAKKKHMNADAEKQLKDKIGYLLASAELPFKLTENTEFKELLQTVADLGSTFGSIDVKSKIPKRKKMKSHMLEMESEKRKVLLHQLKEACNGSKLPPMSFTTDLWTCDSGKYRSYIGIVLRFINQQFEIKECTLGCFYFKDVIEENDNNIHASENEDIIEESEEKEDQPRERKYRFNVCDLGLSEDENDSSDWSLGDEDDELSQQNAEDNQQLEQSGLDQGVSILNVTAEQVVADKTGERIMKAINNILNHSGVAEIVKQDENYIYTTDNGANLVKAIRDFSKALHLRCMNHNQNLALVYALNEMEKIETFKKMIENTKKIVTFCKEAGIMDKLTVTLKQEIKTRWISVLNLLKSIKKNWSQLIVLLSQRNKLDLMAGYSCNDLSDVIELLEHWEKVSVKLEASKHHTMQLVLPEYHTLLKHTLAVSDNDTALIKQFKKELIKGLQLKLLPKIKGIHWAAAILTPEFRNKIFFKNMQFDSLQKDMTTREDGIKFIQQCLKRIHESKESMQSPDRKKQKIQVSGLYSLSDDEENCNQEEIIDDFERELKQYLNMSIENEINEATTKNPLLFYEKHSKMFPTLCEVAKYIFAAVASSASSERIFSCAGRIITKKRNRLSPKTAGMLIFLKSFIDFFATF